MVKLFAFGAGFATAIFIIGEGINLALALSAKRLADIEDDGWMTLYPETDR